MARYTPDEGWDGWLMSFPTGESVSVDFKEGKTYILYEQDSD